MQRLVRGGLVLAAVGLCLSGCASVSTTLSRLVGTHPKTEHAKVRAVSAGLDATPVTKPSDRLYDNATRAIRARDYGKALDLLQLARQSAPDDARVLNALGVVYDKLGRFELSARYYQLASAADPASPIVASNIRYSAYLRRESLALREQAQAPKPAVAAAAPLAAVTNAPEITLARSTVTPRQAGPLFAGSSLTLVNASGRVGGQDPVRQYLAAEGWSVKSRLEARPMQARSEVRFAEQHRALAQALARTLPFKVSLSSCGVDCSGLELIVGADAQVRGPVAAKRGLS